MISLAITRQKYRTDRRVKCFVSSALSALGYACNTLDYQRLSDAIINFGGKPCSLQLVKRARTTVEPFGAEQLSQDLLFLYNKVLFD